jgi:alkylhydroperoxidase family enzyme
MKLPEPRIQPVQKSEWTTEQRKLLESFGQADREFLESTNDFKTFICHPKLIKRWLAFAIYIGRESTLQPRDKELLILRTCWLCQAEYPWSWHAVFGKQAGLTDQEILRITKGPNAEGWSSFDTTLLQAVDELQEEAFISNATWAALAERYTEQQIMDLVFTVGQYNLASMAINSLGSIDCGDFCFSIYSFTCLVIFFHSIDC